MKKKAKSFTVIELLIVITIIGLLAAALLPSIIGDPSKASEAAKIAEENKKIAEEEKKKAEEGQQKEEQDQDQKDEEDDGPDGTTPNDDDLEEEELVREYIESIRDDDELRGGFEERMDRSAGDRDPIDVRP